MYKENTVRNEIAFFLHYDNFQSNPLNYQMNIAFSVTGSKRLLFSFSLFLVVITLYRHIYCIFNLGLLDLQNDAFRLPH